MQETLLETQIMSDLWTISRIFTIFGGIDLVWLLISDRYRRSNQVVPWYFACPYTHSAVLRELLWGVVFGILALTVSLD